MDAEIKKIADSRDLKSLKYIFVDSLDVDPTFMCYEEEYNYCKSIPGLLETYQELTPFTENKTSWNEAYWTNLKMDLIKNFSDKRMTHMREVAKVFLAEKIQRILTERSITVIEGDKIEPINVTPKPNTSSTVTSNTVKSDVSLQAKPHLSKAEEQELELQKEKEHFDREYKDEEERIQAKKEKDRRANSNEPNGTDLKKAQGVAVVAVTVIVVVAIVVAIILLQK
ncbi:MAG: hypothetical protein RR310_05215 [Eubacterium sp.]